ncbi:cytochrome P450 81E8-like [Helianthus annuus]|uniref:cytochrome P450 81E8-like n=1 Tax=Helianthus annuus TaxID=4232 RepID=UPI00165330F9|nr:cytochrome P450 81E8-like [Helianthus annuus]
MVALLKLAYREEVDLVVLVLAAVFSILWLIWKLKSNNGGTNPSLPPGPRGLPIVGNLLSLDTELHSQFANRAKTYGPIMTLWLALSLNPYKVSSYGGNDIVWLPYGDKWRVLRKILVSQMLTKETLDSFYYLRRKEIRNSIKHVYNTQVGCPVNIGDLMFLTIMNVVMGMIWGGTKDGIGFGVEFRNVINEVTRLMAAPNLSDFYPGLAWLDLQGIEKSMVAMKKIDGIFDRIIDERRKMDCGGDGIVMGS